MGNLPTESGYYWARLYADWDYDTRLWSDPSEWQIVKIELDDSWANELSMWEFGNDYDTELEKIAEWRKIEPFNG